MNNILAGSRILITRPHGQADGLISLIREVGGNPLAYPTLAIELLNPGPAMIEPIFYANDVIFTSRNAVLGLAALTTIPANLRCFAVGRTTASEIKNQFPKNHSICVPVSSFDSEGLLDLPELQKEEIIGKRISIIKGVGGRELLADELDKRGAEVTYIEVYKRIQPNALLLPRNINAVVATSNEGITNLLKMSTGVRLNSILGLPLIVMSHRNYNHAIRLGFHDISVAKRTGDSGLVEALIDRLSPFTNESM
jgi:uroporphyrinogen-III synthase